MRLPRRHLLASALLCAALSLGTLSPSPASAGTLRYAIIVGNNVGSDDQLTGPLPALGRAEREAELLRERLVQFANFDPSRERTVLLTGATRAQLEQAFAKLKKTIAADRETYGDSKTLFFFFYTGHGLQERLLMVDRPVSAPELGEMIKALDATFTVGVFDACYSGTLDSDDLVAKGIRSLPGLNPMSSLPEMELAAEGALILVSSGPNEPSYEDPRLGGVFTHFFTEALSKAPRSGPGITLSSMWEYARHRTKSYTASRGRSQTPVQDSRLRTSGPLFFSFPRKRTATLQLAPSISGKFLLTYDEGQLTEAIDKTAGRPMEVSVYPGKARLMLLDGGVVQAQKSLSFTAHARVTLRGAMDPPTGGTELWQKGGAAFGSQRLQASETLPAGPIALGVGYEFTPSRDTVLMPEQSVALTLRYDTTEATGSGVVGAFQVGWGVNTARHAGLSYRYDAVLADLSTGYGLRLGTLQLSFLGSVAAGYGWQDYADGVSREGHLLGLSGVVDLLWPVDGPFAVSLDLRAGALHSQGAAATFAHDWRLWLGGGATMSWRF